MLIFNLAVWLAWMYSYVTFYNTLILHKLRFLTASWHSSLNHLLFFFGLKTCKFSAVSFFDSLIFTHVFSISLWFCDSFSLLSTSANLLWYAWSYARFFALAALNFLNLCYFFFFFQLTYNLLVWGSQLSNSGRDHHLFLCSFSHWLCLFNVLY